MKNAIEIRCIRENELGLLKDFLYEAIFIPEGVEPPSRDIVEKPELRVYTDGFGTKSGDNCLVAIHDGKKVGAVWTRIMNDYGHVDDETPSFAISLYKEYRRKGIGTRLMEEMLDFPDSVRSCYWCLMALLLQGLADGRRFKSRPD